MKRIAFLLIAVLAVFSNVSAKNDMKANDDANVQSTNVLGKLYFVISKRENNPS